MDKGKLALKIFGWILLTLSISACSSPNQTNRADAQDAALTAGELDSSPAEDVIKTYLAGLRDQDFDQMLGTFDLECFRDTGPYEETEAGLPWLPEVFIQTAEEKGRQIPFQNRLGRQRLIWSAFSHMIWPAFPASLWGYGRYPGRRARIRRRRARAAL